MRKIPTMRLCHVTRKAACSQSFVRVPEPAAPTLSPTHCTRHPLCGDRHIVCDLYVMCSNITIIWHVTDLYSSANIVRVIKSGRMRWVGHVERIEERRGVCRVLVEKPEGKKPKEEPDVDRRIILSWIFRNWDVGAWTGSIWLGKGTLGGHLSAAMNVQIPQNARNFLTS